MKNAVEPLFAIYPGGITTSDEPKLKMLASRPDAMQAFYATAILDLTAKLTRGELKGVSPADLYIGIVKKA